MATSEGTRDTIQAEVEQNYRAFERVLPDLLEKHSGKFALMRHGEIIEFFDTSRDAYFAGQKLFADHLFSVQEINEAPINLGYFSYAMPERQV